jgi:hypothetical protein
VKRCQNISTNSCCEEVLGEASFKKKAFTEKQEQNPTNKQKCTGRRILTSIFSHYLLKSIWYYKFHHYRIEGKLSVSFDDAFLPSFQLLSSICLEIEKKLDIKMNLGKLYFNLL